MSGTGTRTLIIDNYDSFTFNLFHLIADVTGVAPEVVHNDEPGWTLDELDRFDNVVISAGPGRPERATDFGVCADVIRAGRRPLLGVCLGHQGICSVFGGTLEAAPEPVHGLLSPVFHRQSDVFAGLPSPFAAVRYHSLLVTQLPAELQPIGRTPDGLLMAVRHRDRPIWGVQFHPDSVCTQYGRSILRNFDELTQAFRATHAIARSPTRSTAAGGRGAHTPQMRERQPSQRYRVRWRKLATSAGSELVFDACFRRSADAFWLDSSLGHDEYGRFSFMGDASGPFARIATADVRSSRITVRSAAGTQVLSGSFFDWIAADLEAHPVVGPALPFDFMLGWVGYLGYELKAECGAEGKHRSPHPDAAMLFADRAIAFDHVEQTVYLLVLDIEGDGASAETWLRETTATIERLGDEPPSSAPERLPASHVAGLTLRVGRTRYLELIDRAKQAITAGETYEVCLTNMVTASGSLDPWSAYRQLRHENPAPFAALLRFGSLSVLSCSPERFISVSSDGRLESKPIKGTRPRAASPQEDERLARELRESPKDRAENLMIVDLVRNDLGTCAEVGSVHVAKLFDVETYPTVHQLVSTVRARLRPDRSSVDCVRSAFPGGSMTGAPKLRTMSIIDGLEEGPRGVYSGALGYFSLSGAADFSIVIRTLVVEPDRISFGVGGAITALSDPRAEFEETAVKATPFLRLLGTDFPDREARDRGR